jgi:hypothetical protein
MGHDPVRRRRHRAARFTRHDHEVEDGLLPTGQAVQVDPQVGVSTDCDLMSIGWNFRIELFHD